MVAAVQLGSGNCSAVVTQLLLLLSLSLGLSGSSGQGTPSAPASSSSTWSTATPGAPVGFHGVCKAEKWLLSAFTLLCLAKAPICREGRRAGCQRADNAALIYMLLASAKFSTAAMDPFVFSLHFCFVLRILITFTNGQWNFFPILCCIHEFFYLCRLMTVAC